MDPDKGLKRMRTAPRHLNIFETPLDAASESNDRGSEDPPRGSTKRPSGSKKRPKCRRSACEHGRTDRFRCLACFDLGRAYVTTICEHRRQRHQCRDCGGSSFCEHNRSRTRCLQCFDLGRPEATAVCPLHRTSKSHCRRCKDEKEALVGRPIASTDIKIDTSCGAGLDVNYIATPVSIIAPHDFKTEAKIQPPVMIAQPPPPIPEQMYCPPSLCRHHGHVYSGFWTPPAPFFEKLCIHGNCPEDCDECELGII